MKKSLFILPFLSLILLADNSLGTPIGSTTTIQHKTKVEKKSPKTIQSKVIKDISSQHKTDGLTTRITPKKVQSSFRKDSHRYDKRYRDFDYEDNGYYNDDGYYYGYYDNHGYFYDNIFYVYDNQYTYYNRRHHLGYFGHSYHHHRPYVYHSYNNWNRVHCYREPNTIVYGHYYSPPARMTTRHNNYNSSRNNNNTYNSHQHYNNYGSQNSSRISTRNSSPSRNYNQHKSTSRMQIAR